MYNYYKCVAICLPICSNTGWFLYIIDKYCMFYNLYTTGGYKKNKNE